MYAKPSASNSTARTSQTTKRPFGLVIVLIDRIAPRRKFADRVERNNSLFQQGGREKEKKHFQIHKFLPWSGDQLIVCAFYNQFSNPRVLALWPDSHRIYKVEIFCPVVLLEIVMKCSICFLSSVLLWITDLRREPNLSMNPTQSGCLKFRTPPGHKGPSVMGNI